MANDKNLVTSTKFQSGEKAAENGKKGGIKSGESKRNKKAIREIANDILHMPLSEMDKRICKQLNIPSDQVPNKGAMAFLSCFYHAVKRGDTNSLEKLYNISGERIGLPDMENESEEDEQIIIIMKPKEFPTVEVADAEIIEEKKDE